MSDTKTTEELNKEYKMKLDKEDKMRKELQEVISKIANAGTKFDTIHVKNGKCTAHLYHLERQGDSEKSRYIYRCLRPGCRHYATFTNITNRAAQCRKCGNTFNVQSSLLIKNREGTNEEEIFVEYPDCGCELKKDKFTKTITIDEVDLLEGEVE